MGISVIVPVYNAEEFVEAAVLSALAIDEVRQIILIEDHSPDNSLTICQDLARRYPDLVELYTHPGRQQLGAGASRNLGIEKAREELIAFLDADDYYLPHRFEYPLELLRKHTNIDYVVSPSQLEHDYLNRKGKYTMMSEAANNTTYNLFPALLTERHGYFDTNSILIRSQSLKRLSQLFNPTLTLHQDSELWLRIAYKLRGHAENVTLPGSIVRRHSKNRITHRNANSLSLYWDTVANEFQRRKVHRTLARFIRLKKKHYQYLKENSPISYLYLLYVWFYDVAVLPWADFWNVPAETGLTPGIGLQPISDETQHPLL